MTLIKQNRFFRDRLEHLKEHNLHRCLRAFQGEQGPWIELDGRHVLNLCSNNYLGLASHNKVKEATATAVRYYGCSSGASRLICGTMDIHECLEKQLAIFKGKEAALLYSTGYNANVGIISSLVGRGDIVFSDELNHASLVDGCRLSRATVNVFPHNNMDALEERLHRACEVNQEGQRLIVVDGVFSMDGDIAPLPRLADLAEKYEASVMVDEAHATGTLGPGGRGSVAYFGLDERIPIIMGTMGKALGGFGAFVAGSQELREFLINTSRSFIFTTALPPAVTASAIAALEVLKSDQGLVARLQDNAQYLRQKLRELGFNTLHSQTQIMPVVIGDAGLTYRMSELLLEENVLATAIRPPTVPEGTSRIRVSVMATHTIDDLNHAVRAFEKAGRALGILGGGPRSLSLKSCAKWGSDQ